MVSPAELLRERGIQVTAQRLAVLRVVSGSPHITADAVAEAVRAQIGAISTQSVYDALNTLVAGKLLRRIQPAGSAARYEDRVGDNHHHLICRICGRVVDVDCATGSAPCLAASDDQGYEIDEAEVAYWGRCPDCVANASGRPEGLQPRRTAGTSKDVPLRKAGTSKEVPLRKKNPGRSQDLPLRKQSSKNPRRT